MLLNKPKPPESNGPPAGKGPTHTASVVLQESEWLGLQRLALARSTPQRRMSASDLIREAIRRYLAAER